MKFIKMYATENYGLILYQEQENFFVQIFHPSDIQINTSTDQVTITPFDYHYTSNFKCQLLINMRPINNKIFSLIKIEKESDFDLIKTVCEACYGE